MDYEENIRLIVQLFVGNRKYSVGMQVCEQIGNRNFVPRYFALGRFAIGAMPYFYILNFCLDIVKFTLTRPHGLVGSSGKRDQPHDYNFRE